MSRPAIARIHLDHLRHNFRLLKQKAGTATVMAIVKANAYGHGLHLVAPALSDEGCTSFGVTDACEGARLRALLPDADITLLSGIFDEDDAQLAQEHRLTPVLTGSWQTRQLAQISFTGDAWIKLDTGMKRLGAESAIELLAACREAGFGIAGLMSHLACADEPGHPQNMEQAENFSRFRHELGMQLPTSLLNSAGILTLADSIGDVVRPGIALYGAEPIPAQPMGLKPVMQFTGRIIQIRDLQVGDSVSYGASFTARQPMRIATVCLGYADGLPRQLSNTGYGILGGNRARIIGRVCMDYTLIDVSDLTASQGDEVEFWGAGLPANDVAKIAGTISYTLFTGVGQRVQRLPVP